MGIGEWVFVAGITFVFVRAVHIKFKELQKENKEYRDAEKYAISAHLIELADSEMGTD